jgi:hypothetical protein
MGDDNESKSWMEHRRCSKVQRCDGWRGEIKKVEYFKWVYCVKDGWR